MNQEKILLSLFRREDYLTLFDIGSCDGSNTLRYQQLFPNAKLRAFEPIPNNYQRILDKLAQAGTNNITVHEIALSDVAGECSMHVSSQTNKTENKTFVAEQSSSLLPPDKHLLIYPTCKFDKVITVKTDTIENFCKLNSIPAIDFIHLDVQGAELMVLKGAGEFLSQIKSVWLEVEHVQLYKNQPLRQDIESFMTQHGFVLTDFRVGGYSGDQFYINERFLVELKRTGIRLLKLRGRILRHPAFVRANQLARKVKFLLRKI